MRFLILGATVLRVLFLQAKSLWFDEGTTVMLSRVPLSRLTDFVVRDEVMPPLYHFVVRLFLGFFADPRLALRLFSVVCGVAAVFAFRRLAERVLPERARLLAVFLAAASSYWIHLSQDGRPYALLLLISASFADAVFALAEKPSRRPWLEYFAWAVAGLYTHYFFAVLLVTAKGYLFFKRRSLRDFVLVHLALALAVLPWLPFFLTQFALHRHILANQDAMSLLRVFDLLGTMFVDVGFLGLVLPGWITPAIGFTFVAVAAFAWHGSAPKERRSIEAIGSFLLVPFVLMIVAELIVGRPVTQARFLAPFSPFAFLLAALALTGPGKDRRYARLGFEALVVAGAFGYFASSVIVDPRLDRLSASIRESTAADLPLVYLETYYYLPMRAYYMPERRHFLVARAAEGMDYAGYPPYDGVLDDAALASLGPCLVMDEKRLLGGPPRWIGDGAQVAALLKPR